MIPIRAIVAPSLVYRLAEAAAHEASARALHRETLMEYEAARWACVPRPIVTYAEADALEAEMTATLKAGLQLRRVEDAP